MNMSERGPRLGWTLGSVGGILWIGLLGGVLIHKGDAIGGWGGIGIFAIGLVYVFAAAPWRHPDTKFWKIYLGLLVILYGAAAFLIWRWLPFEPDANWMQRLPLLSCVLPLLVPLFTLGNKTWDQIQRRGDNAECNK